MSAPTDWFRYKGNHLEIDGTRLEQVANKFGTPCYVYSDRGFLDPLTALKKGLKGIDHLICFAVKSNSNLSVLSLLTEAGAGMDIVSGGELFRALTAGAPAQEIIFSGVGKTPGEMATALEADDQGIYAFNVESVAELATLSTVAENLGKRARVALRFNPDVDAKTHPYIATGLKRNKFGLDRKEILTIAAAHETFPGVSIEGISIHIGSQILSLRPLRESFTKVRALMKEVEKILPHRLQFVDLGGGLGISYGKERPISIPDFCKLVKEYFGKLSIKVILEPGRLLSGNAGILLTEILYRKVRTQRDFLIVDAAMNDLIRPSLYESHHEIVPVQKVKNGKNKKTDVVGPICETGDFFAQDRSLPLHLNQGDLLAILSAGAYGFSMASNYNSRPRVAEVLIQNGTPKLIRERETYEDLIRGEVHT